MVDVPEYISYELDMFMTTGWQMKEGLIEWASLLERGGRTIFDGKRESLDGVGGFGEGDR